MNRSLGFSQLGQGQTELGLSSLEKAYAANPADNRAGMALATLYSRLGKAERALKIAGEMVKHDPANLSALNFLGSLKGANGDKQGARAAYMQVLVKDPVFVPAALNLSRLDVGERRFDEARRRLDSILKKMATIIKCYLSTACWSNTLAGQVRPFGTWLSLVRCSALIPNQLWC
jgi:Flp pilus assembly protein TadD